MSADSSGKGARYAPGGVARDGSCRFAWNLTTCDLTDAVQLALPPNRVLPVVFVPGIMGSNLRTKKDHSPVWRLDEVHAWWGWVLGSYKKQPLGLARRMAGQKAGDRQSVMNPALLEVDPGGHVPDEPVGSITGAKEYASRGWGEVGESSYQAYLLWLEKHLNGEGYNPAEWKDFSYVAVGPVPTAGEPSPAPELYSGITMQMEGLPATAEIGGAPKPVMSDDLLKRAGFRMPVYACGYNWLADNKDSANRLKTRIDAIIAENNQGVHHCEQVIVVTHSMGGLVARACQKLSGMQDKIAGIVHGVMPTTGAAVAYRRCKVGMKDEDRVAGLVIGETGQDVTAVFAQAPGALELLPTQQYNDSSPWMTFTGPTRTSIAPAQPASGDPYQAIYLNKSQWWGLVRPEWLHPQGGVPITWVQYAKYAGHARDFSKSIASAFHPHTYVFYGKDPAQKSFQDVRWEVSKGVRPEQGQTPVLDSVPADSFQGVRASGNNPLYVGGETVYQPPMGAFGTPTMYDTSFWEIRCGKQDTGGDGTVPICSGAAPKRLGGGAVKQQFGLTGFAHEGAYRNTAAQIVSLYGIVKIAAQAKVPA